VAVSPTFAAPDARSLRAPLLTAAGLAAAGLLVVAVDPAERTIGPPCPLRATTGWWCPGCGLTRAVHHLAHGDLVAALRLNGFVVPVLAVIVLSWSAWVLGAAGRRPAWMTRLTRPSPAVVAAVSVLLVGFAVVRNLPGVDGLRG
jgi:hypothetical protein